MVASTVPRFMLIILVTSEICLRIAAQVTVDVQDPQLIYTLAGGTVANTPWNNGNSPFWGLCGGVIGTRPVGNSVTLIFNGTYVTATLLSAKDGSPSVQLIVDGTPVNPINIQDGTLSDSDFTTCNPLTTSSGTLAAGTHNATLVQLNNLGVMFFHNFIYTPLPVIVSVTSTVTTAVGPSTTSNPASGASTTGGAVATSSSSHSPVGPIVGGVLGGLVIVILAGLWLWRHKHQQRKGSSGKVHENTGVAAYRRSLEEQEDKETSTTAQQRPFSFGHGQSVVGAQHVDIEALPDQQRAVATTITQTPSIASEMSPQRALPALPAPPNTTNPNQFEIIERLISQNVPRQDIVSIVRTMAAAGPSGSGIEAGGDQLRAEAVQRQSDTHTSAMGIEMPQQGEGQHPPMYDFKDGRQI
ncbi:hypothetical protein FRB94_003109 [Tulasnella sp. JGI-2019a]|nr:hypothetical protein FRB94_003109 [Tulasnella sp. JGI-2019a]